MFRGACLGTVLVCSAISLQASVIYAIETPLGPLNLGESVTASVVVNQDFISTVTLSFAYQFQSRLVVSGALFAGSVPVLTAAGLPALSTFGFPTTALLDNSLIPALTTQPVLIQLVTTSGTLSGGGMLILSERQGGGPPFPPDAVPEPSAFAFLGAGIAALAVLRYRQRRLRN